MPETQNYARCWQLPLSASHRCQFHANSSVGAGKARNLHDRAGFSWTSNSCEPVAGTLASGCLNAVSSASDTVRGANMLVGPAQWLDDCDFTSSVAHARSATVDSTEQQLMLASASSRTAAPSRSSPLLLGSGMHATASVHVSPPTSAAVGEPAISNSAIGAARRQSTRIFHGAERTLCNSTRTRVKFAS